MYGYTQVTFPGSAGAFGLKSPAVLRQHPWRSLRADGERASRLIDLGMGMIPKLQASETPAVSVTVGIP